MAEVIVLGSSDSEDEQPSLVGKLAAAAMEGIARQPEAGDNIKGSMIVAAALIEGVSLFGVVVCLLAAL